MNSCNSFSNQFPPLFSDSSLVGLFCGDNSPGTLVSTSNMMLVRFVSDESVTSSGFLADYTAEGKEGLNRLDWNW